MTIEFTELVEPTQLTTSLSILIVSILFLIALIGYRLRNPIIFIMWTLTVIVLISSFIAGLPFIWFWVMVIVSAITISISATVRYIL